MAKITINREKCKGCLLCVNVCPKGSIKQGKSLNSKGAKAVEFRENAECLGCMMCAVICPDCCIEVYK
ncbi:MAG: 4Fe-4S dicluster domain-containing protein [Candidatus Omnitrophica bacterium]|nr:4Fe-4S dicluster domain-containing protein [Candidatus Omnitrophota bacterium]